MFRYILIENIKSSFELEACSKFVALGIQYDEDIPSRLEGDSTRLTQLLTNLLNIALKFSLKGKIKLKIELLHRDKDNIKLNFKVKDSGVGLSKIQQNYIFGHFTNSNIDVLVMENFYINKEV